MPARTFGKGRLEKTFGIYSRNIELLAASAMAVLLLHWLILLWFVLSRIGQLEFLRLHYTVTLGIDWIDSWWKIFVFPAFGLGVFLLNGLIAGVLAPGNKIFSSLIYGITVFLQVIFAIGGLMAILLNG
ncbi:MAG: hypothetical protein V1738_01640 [Patescibacteria group bacterium]